MYRFVSFQAVLNESDNDAARKALIANHILTNVNATSRGVHQLFGLYAQRTLQLPETVETLDKNSIKVHTHGHGFSSLSQFNPRYAIGCSLVIGSAAQLCNADVVIVDKVLRAFRSKL